MLCYSKRSVWLGISAEKCYETLGFWILWSLPSALYRRIAEVIVCCESFMGQFGDWSCIVLCVKYSFISRLLWFSMQIFGCAFLRLFVILKRKHSDVDSSGKNAYSLYPFNIITIREKQIFHPALCLHSYFKLCSCIFSKIRKGLCWKMWRFPRT